MLCSHLKGKKKGGTHSDKGSLQADGCLAHYINRAWPGGGGGGMEEIFIQACVQMAARAPLNFLEVGGGRT